ncbi:MAG: class I SAM-dependent methyltransferase [Nitriliruptoraceae bacterium]
MRIVSWNHARYWLLPSRWLEAARRILRAMRGTRWCRARAITSPDSGVLTARHGEALADAEARVAATGVRLGGAGNLALLYDLCEELQATRVIETGIAYGWSSLAILLSIAPRDGRLWSTDLAYAHTDGHDAIGVAVGDELREHWTILAGPDDTQVPIAVDAAGAIDLAHYDSAKTPDEMRATSRHLWTALRTGGVLVVDDVGDHLGLRDFTAEVGVDPVVVRHAGKFQGILRKPEA